MRRESQLNALRKCPRLIVITDMSVGEERLFQSLTRYLAEASPLEVVVQLRDKDLPARERLRLALRLRALTDQFNQFLVVNDALDIALLSEADGLHLPEAGLPVGAARARAPHLWLSAACHDVSSARDVDALLVSPVVSARKGREPLGLVALKEWAGKSARPVYALGGVDEASAAACLEAGAAGVAVMGAVFDGRSPGPLLSALKIRRSERNS